MNDEYGIGREFLIKEAGIRNIFTPNKPIDAIELFFGRKDIVKSVIEGLNTPGQHLLLYGDRGVGKSSLANVTAKILDQSGLIEGKLSVKRCSSSDTFSTILEQLLKEYCGEALPSESTVTTKGKENLGVKVLGIGAGIENEITSSQKYTHQSVDSPSKLASVLKNKSGLILIDEFDTLSNSDDKKKVSELIKLLSDYNSPFKIFIVGIAKSGTDLTAGHPSVKRCLKEIKLDRMSDPEIKTIFVSGMKKLNIDVSDQVSEIVVDISNGYPHFAHLIGLKCAEEAVTSHVSKIIKETLIVSLDKAVKDAEGTMKRLYDNATQNTSATKSRNIKSILKACSASAHDDFCLDDITSRLKDYNNELSNSTVSNYLREFTDTNGESIFCRITRGVYRFNDPRMLSYIKIKENIQERTPEKIPYGQI